MPKKIFLIKQTLAEGWRLMKANLLPLLGLQLVGLVLFGFLGYIGNVFANQPSLLTQLLGAGISTFANLLSVIAIVFISLKVLDHKKLELTDLFSEYRHLINMFLASLLYAIVVLIGLIMFIIPGIIFAVRFSLFPYFIVDKGSGPIRALEQSWDSVKGVSWKVFFMGLLCILINIGGLLCLIIGVLFTFPATEIALAAMYRSLSKQTFELQETSSNSSSS